MPKVEIMSCSAPAFQRDEQILKDTYQQRHLIGYQDSTMGKTIPVVPKTLIPKGGAFTSRIRSYTVLLLGSFLLLVVMSSKPFATIPCLFSLLGRNPTAAILGANGNSSKKIYYNAEGKVTGATDETVLLSQILTAWRTNRQTGDDVSVRNITYQTKVFNVEDYGAVGDGQTLNTEAFRKAFQAATHYVNPTKNPGIQCPTNSLAIVSVQNGIFRIGGTVDLFSSTYLYVDSTAVLMGSFFEQDYPYPSAWEPEGNPLYPNGTLPILLRAKGQHHTGIFGEGIIDGGALPGYIDGYNASIDKLQPHVFRQTTSPPCQGECRPQLVLFEHCDSVVVQDITLQNSPDWTLHVRGSSNIMLTRLKIWGDWRWPNNDGVDIDSCHNVTLSQSTIHTADDAICIKTTLGYGTTENIWIRDNAVQSRSSAFKIGSSTQEDVSSVFVDHLYIKGGTNRGIAIQHRDGGNIYEIHVRNVVIENTEMQPKGWWGTGEAIYVTSTPRYASNWSLGRVSHVTLENIRAYSISGTSIVAHRPLPRGVLKRIRAEIRDVDTNNSTITDLAFLDVKLCMKTRITPLGQFTGIGITYEQPSRDYRPTDIQPEIKSFSSREHIGLYLEHTSVTSEANHPAGMPTVYFHDSLITFPPSSDSSVMHLPANYAAKQRLCLAGEFSSIAGLGCRVGAFCDF